MRKHCFAVLLIAFFLLSSANAQQIPQDENRDRAMTVPSSHLPTAPGPWMKSTRTAGAGNSERVNPTSSAMGEPKPVPQPESIHARPSDSAALHRTHQQSSLPPRFVLGKADYLLDFYYRPTSIVVGDFNGDGIPDVATALISDWYEPEIVVLLGNPDGTMRESARLTFKDNADGLAAADLNGDGRLDLVVCDSFSTVAVVLGNGDGTFQSPEELATPYNPRGVTAADLDGDGIPDLVVASNTEISIFLNKGEARFRDRLDYSPHANWTVNGPVAVGDLNGDGKPDLAIPSFNVVVMLGNGDGTFQDGQAYAPESSPSRIVIGDFNGDHHADLAVTNQNANTVSVLLGNGSGQFPDSSAYSTGATPTSIVATDLNGDQKLDLVIADQATPYAQSPTFGSVSVLLGNGDGTFQQHVDYNTGTLPTLGIADCNGDGIPDLAVASQTSTDPYLTGFAEVATVLGNGDGTFPGANYASHIGLSTLATANLNAGGKLDLVAAFYLDPADSNISVLLGNGNGTFQPPADYAGSSSTQSLVTGDFNRDGKQDVAVALSNQVAVFLGKGDGTFPTHSDIPNCTSPTKMISGDFNNDGKPDLVTTCAEPDISVLLGQGDGSFAAARMVSTGSQGWGVAAGDFNLDGKLDLAVTLFSNQIAVLLGNGDGTFQAPVIYPSAPDPEAITVADLNGDGKPDLAVGFQYSPGNWGGISVLLGNGDGTFQPHSEWDAGGGYEYSSPRVITAVDVDGDGILDLVATVGSYDSNNAVANSAVSILHGVGDGTFPGYQKYAQQSNDLLALALGDFAGDGGIDLAVGNFATGNVTVLLNAPVIAVFPSHSTFAPQTMGDTSLPHTFLISNPGSAPIKFSSIVSTGDFAQTNNCPQTLGVGASCSIIATFKPTDLGVRTGNVTLQDNALAGRQVIQLSGVANSALKLSSTAVSFAAPPGKTDARSVTLSNRSNQSILISKIVIAGPDSTDFAQTNNCNSMVPAHGSCSFTLTFKPARTGTKLAGVSISDTDPSSPQAVMLRGVSRY